MEVLTAVVKLLVVIYGCIFAYRE